MYHIKLEEVSINYVSCDFDLKNLEVKNLKLSGTSGHILINKIKCDSYDCKTVSSLNEFSDCSINNFLVSTVSGEVLVYSSILEKVKINSVSGITNLQLSELPKEIRVDSLSGDVNFYLPKYQTFGVYYDTKSGQFYSDLEIEELADIIYDVYTINGDLSIYEYVK